MWRSNLTNSCLLPRNHLPVRTCSKRVVEREGVVLVKVAKLDKTVEGDKKWIFFDHPGNKVDKLDLLWVFVKIFLFHLLWIFLLLLNLFVLFVFFGQFSFHWIQNSNPNYNYLFILKRYIFSFHQPFVSIDSDDSYEYPLALMKNPIIPSVPGFMSKRCGSFCGFITFIPVIFFMLIVVANHLFEGFFTLMYPIPVSMENCVSLKASGILSFS